MPYNVAPLELVVLVVLSALVAYLALRRLAGFLRPDQRRICPACGTRADEGETRCPRCGYDYRAAAGMPPADPGGTP